MRDILRIVRLGLLFINYIICIVACRGSYMLNDVSVASLVGLSVLLLCGSIVLSYRYLNVNVIYNGIYAVLMLILVLDKNLRLSDMRIFVVLTVVMIVAIFCWYLRVYEYKIQKIVIKGGEQKEIEEAYKKQILSLLLVLVLTWIALMITYYVLQDVSARVITYLCSSNVIFSVPALGGFLLIMLVSIFIFVVYVLA